MRANHALLGFSSGLAALCLVSAASTQSAESNSPTPYPSVAPQAESWLADHGASWRYDTDSQTGYANFLYGGSSLPQSEAQSDADYFQLARQAFGEVEGFFGIEGDTLLNNRVMLLPLGLIGSTDKISVQFNQAVNGVPIRRGFANAIFHVGGELLALDTTGLPNVANFNATPTVSSTEATEAAVAEFTASTGIFATDISEPTLTIERNPAAKLAEPVLVWEVRVLHQLPTTSPEGFTYLVAAQGSPAIVATENAIHNFDVGGTVMTNATPGLKPDTAGNPEVQFPAAHMRVTAGGNTTFTDVNGNFNFAGLTGPVNVTFQYEGRYNNVANSSGAEHILTQSLSGTGNNVLMNATINETRTAEANVFTHINMFREWTRSVDPSDNKMDAVNTANVMLSSTCNAFYNGSSTNYFNAGGGCNNTAYSTVIYHEQGHWQNDRYGSGNGGDGFGEGNADVFAMYQSGSPVIGRDFFGNSPIRTGLNTRQWCGSGCYGQVHTDGEVWMGAAWKVRRNLVNSVPNGADIASNLFIGWMNAFNQGQISPTIETQWLTLDDNDGNINNGTPHYTEIDNGFLEQGFPGFALSFVNFANQIEPVDTLDDNGPYGIAADLTPVTGNSITTALIGYTVNGGATQFVPMTNVINDTWAATIPGIPSPAQLTWYIQAADDLGNSDTYPKGAPAKVNAFKVGEVSSFFLDDFEGGTAGWTHALVANQDDWQLGAPTGSSGDSPSAFSGTNVWANDLGQTGWNGAYQANTENWLRSPNIDLSSATGSTLSFKRWLTVEEGIFDQATIRVNGTQVWANPLNNNLIDTSWFDFSLDISAIADGVANTQVEFRLKTDGGLEFGGWGLDDFEILSFSPTPTGCLPVNYGSGLAGTGGVTPTIDTGKQPSRIGNADHVIKVKNGPPLATAFIGIGTAAINFPISGGTLLVLPTTIMAVNLDVFGQFESPAPLANNPGSVGMSFFLQAFILDPGAPQGISMTDGMQATICN